MQLARAGSSGLASSHPKLHQQSTCKMSTFGLQNSAQIWNKTCPEITSKLYQNLASKMIQSWLQKWSVWSEPSKVFWHFARARSSQMDFEASSFLDSSPVRSSLRQMQFIISRPPLSKPIRSSPLEPNAHLSFKATVLEANPLEPARANCISDLKQNRF